VVAETIKVTDYPFDATGAVVIPSTIVGKPVTSIGGNTFFGCNQITQITIPASVVQIGQSFTRHTGSLQSFVVEAGNPAFSVSNGILFNKDKTQLLRCPSSSFVKNYTIPNTVVTVLNGAFLEVSNLRSVIIPASVSQLETWAFNQCSHLTAAVFLGDAPVMGNGMGGSVFDDAATSFKVYYSDHATGYSSPTWFAYPAESFDGDYKFHIFNDGVSIDYYSGNETGEVVIPSSFAGFPVRNLLGISFGNRWASHFVIPEGVSYIGTQAFRNNHDLTSIIIPSTVTSMASYIFQNCENLDKVLFAGDAPAGWGSDVFQGGSSNVMLYYFSDKSGFSTPTWNGYPTTEIDRAIYPATKWLFRYDLPYDSDLNTDVSADHVNLLMEYALNLNPHDKNQDNLPKAIVDTETETIGMNYYGASEGVTYTVEVSTTLTEGSWTTSGMFHSSNGDLHSTFFLFSGPRQFVRLRVESNTP